MRDRSARRNHSPAAEQFRREHDRHRAWGLRRRHAERLRRIRTRADEVAQPGCRVPESGTDSRPDTIEPVRSVDSPPTPGACGAYPAEQAAAQGRLSSDGMSQSHHYRAAPCPGHPKSTSRRERAQSRPADRPAVNLPQLHEHAGGPALRQASLRRSAYRSGMSALLPQVVLWSARALRLSSWCRFAAGRSDKSVLSPHVGFWLARALRLKSSCRFAAGGPGMSALSPRVVLRSARALRLNSPCRFAGRFGVSALSPRVVLLAGAGSSVDLTLSIRAPAWCAGSATTDDPSTDDSLINPTIPLSVHAGRARRPQRCTGFTRQPRPRAGGGRRQRWHTDLRRVPTTATDTTSPAKPMIGQRDRGGCCR